MNSICYQKQNIMKILKSYQELKQKAVQFLSEGNLEEYFKTLLLVESIETKINKLVLLN